MAGWHKAIAARAESPITISVPMQTPVAKPGRPCSVCRHPGRAEIEAALIRGAPLRAVAAAFAATPAALHRHRTGHMARPGATGPVGAVAAPVAPHPPAPPPSPPAPAPRRLQGWSEARLAARPGDRCSCCGGSQWWALPDASRGGCARCAPPSAWGVRRFET
jgi:hypothetical protein